MGRTRSTKKEKENGLNAAEMKKEILKEIEKKLPDMIKKALSEVNVGNTEVRSEKFNLEFSGKKVMISTFGKAVVTTVAGKEINMNPNNVYVFELPKNYKKVNLVSPFDEIFEVIKCEGKFLKLRPRISYVLKDKHMSIIGIE